MVDGFRPPRTWPSPCSWRCATLRAGCETLLINEIVSELVRFDMSVLPEFLSDARLEALERFVDGKVDVM